MPRWRRGWSREAWTLGEVPCSILAWIVAGLFSRIAFLPQIHFSETFIPKIFVTYLINPPSRDNLLLLLLDPPDLLLPPGLLDGVLVVFGGIEAMRVKGFQRIHALAGTIGPPVSPDPGSSC
jgi:hypothetical protein